MVWHDPTIKQVQTRDLVDRLSAHGLRLLVDQSRSPRRWLLMRAGRAIAKFVNRYDIDRWLTEQEANGRIDTL